MTDAELEAGKQAVREKIDAAGYGSWVSDEQCEDVARSVLEAAEQARNTP